MVCDHIYFSCKTIVEENFLPMEDAKHFMFDVAIMVSTPDGLLQQMLSARGLYCLVLFLLVKDWLQG